MPKLTNVFEEKAEGLENINKRITKNVSENIQKVDSIISSARSPSSLFNIQAISARIKLRDACERAVMSGSTSYSQRMEEILWRKVYYEPLSAAKKMRKGSSWSEIECGYIWSHLNDGIAFYHHFLMTIMSSASNNNVIHYTADLLPVSYHDDFPSTKSKENNSLSLEDSFFRSLTCLGDLARYMLDIPLQISSNTAYLLSVRYYHQALHHNCEGGLTHSNLATVYSTNNHPLLAAVHYLRAITCEKPFEAAENNLRRMLDKSRIWLENKKLEKESGVMKEGGSLLGNESTQFLHTCLTLLSCFINNKRMEEVAVLCQDVLLQLGKLLDNYDNVEPPDVSETSSDPPIPPPPSLKGINGYVDPTILVGGKNSVEDAEEDRSSNEGGIGRDVDSGDSTSFLLTPESMVTLCALFIICTKRLKMQASPHSNMSEVLLISILLTLVTHINTRLEQRFALIDPAFVHKLLPAQEQNLKGEEKVNEENKDANVCNGDKNKKGKNKRNKLAKLRRKRNKELDLDNEDDSETEGGDCDGNSEDSCNESEVTSSSDDEDVFDASLLCSSENDDDSDDDVKVESEEEWEGMTVEEHIDLVGQEGMLASVNVTLQWFFSDEEMIKLCGRTAHNLWSSLAKLFNLLRVDYEGIRVSDSSSTQREMIVKRLREMRKESFDLNAGNEGEMKTVIGSLPENLMLHLVIPMFTGSCVSTSAKFSEANLVRLYRLNSVMLKLCNREDTPLRLKDDKFVICEEKAKSISDGAKLENERNTENRSTPSTPTHNASLAHSKVDDSIASKQAETSHSEHTPQSTPKRLPQGAPPPISSKVASSMQSLTAQWLQHEVRNLEEKTSRRTKLGGLYLVPDASVLINHLSTIKQILATPSHMVIIPQVVIDSLDQSKRESVGARDAIRWLEVKLRYGSRFMRAQRPHEKAHLPLIKYPKRKDKEAWEWFHLAECCYYLGAQMNKTDSKTSTVTLLTAEASNKVAKKSFSLQTLAEAAGAVLQSVDEFVRKWQISTKGHS